MSDVDSSAVSPLTLPQNRYPTGWFQVAWSDDVAVGDVKLVHYFGEDIVLWRGESGQATPSTPTASTSAATSA